MAVYHVCNLKKSNLLFIINSLISFKQSQNQIVYKLCLFDFVEWLHIEIQENLSPLNIDLTTAVESKL